jgi:hypothetical protein
MEDGVELGRFSGCDFAHEVEEVANERSTEIKFDNIVHESAEVVTTMLNLCRAQWWDDAVSLLDQSNVLGTPWGQACTMQVMNYHNGNWVDYAADGIATYDLKHWYTLIRLVLYWDGPIKLAVATK